MTACGTPAGGWPDPFDLPSLATPPDPFTTFTGDPVTTPAAWTEVRVPELRALFEHYIYGEAPAATPVAVTLRHQALLPDGIAYDEYEVDHGSGLPPMWLAVFRPANAPGPVPVFLAANACGNQSVIAATEVRQSTAFQQSTCEPGRGAYASEYPIATIVARGVALATFHQSDIAADDPTLGPTSGVMAGLLQGGDPATRWGTIAAWAWGLSQAVTALGQVAGVDPTRIATVGHSRRGKAALLAAAFDPRIAMALPHQSGTAGATLTRSDGGEPVLSINLIFPHWFDAHFKAFNDDEHRLPIDQHLLVGMVAPRPVLLTNGVDDTWADPPGALATAELADPIYAFLGASGLVRDNQGAITLDGRLAWHQRDGGHALEARDWDTFLAFAQRHW